ncbi:MAG: TadE family protein [Lachnotalea sp.]
MELKGSYTIEAALLMPIIVGTTVILIYMSFFLHDRAVVYEGAIFLANKYTNEQNVTNQEIKQKLGLESEQVINERVICTKNINTQIVVTNKEISVTINGKFYFPNMYVVNTIFNKEVLDISITKKIKRENPVSFIRQCIKIEKLLN